jgi:quinohemoprotein ethanol dehydrogenase
VNLVTAAAPLSNIRNLGYVSTDVLANLDKQLFNGPFIGEGMPDFTGKLTADQVTRIQAFIQATADSIREKAPD